MDTSRCVARHHELSTSSGFTEQKTSDGYGYRFVRGRTVIDVMIPEGLDRQRTYPKTVSGRPGLAVDGGNQALTRAERLPVNLGGRIGYDRRPTLMGAQGSRLRGRQPRSTASRPGPDRTRASSAG